MKPLLNGTNHGEELSGPTPITVMTTWRDLIVNALQENHQMDGRMDGWTVSHLQNNPLQEKMLMCPQAGPETPRLNQHQQLFWSWYKSFSVQNSIRLFLEPV